MRNKSDGESGGSLLALRPAAFLAALSHVTTSRTDCSTVCPSL